MDATNTHSLEHIECTVKMARNGDITISKLPSFDTINLLNGTHDHKQLIFALDRRVMAYKKEIAKGEEYQQLKRML